ncbi:MAG: hypothetical protein KF802_09620 [Bdellovibrionaceae bacterium]|nr:hypothetical protein [Pseudobdellovibrionaceae bacterium]MBX3033624.1 hypothetical protein [Pseudobdellovibrionaceae bacterium]
MTASWLPLTDYSMKYKVSVSTLRRRIKAEDIKFRFEDGKYLIFDEAPTGSPHHQPQRVHRPSLTRDEAQRTPGETDRSGIQARLSKAELTDEPVLLAANKLLNELKRAYSQILQEKEEQILQLKEEVADLKTLVRVLESENGRLKQVY